MCIHSKTGQYRRFFWLDEYQVNVYPPLYNDTCKLFTKNITSLLTKPTDTISITQNTTAINKRIYCNNCISGVRLTLPTYLLTYVELNTARVNSRVLPIRWSLCLCRGVASCGAQGSCDRHTRSHRVRKQSHSSSCTSTSGPSYCKIGNNVYTSLF